MNLKLCTHPLRVYRSHALRSPLYTSINIPTCAKRSDRALDCRVVRKGSWCLSVNGFDSRNVGVSPAALVTLCGSDPLIAISRPRVLSDNKWFRGLIG